MQALRTAASGMSAQQLNVEVISNNIANMNTVGFKRQRAEFQDLLYQTLERAGAQSSDQGTMDRSIFPLSQCSTFSGVKTIRLLFHSPTGCRILSGPGGCMA